MNNNYTEQQVPGFDAAMVTSSDHPDILIDFRHSESSESDRSDIEKMIEKLSAYNEARQKGNFVLIIESFFNPNATINQALLTTDFNSLIEATNPFYHEKILYSSVSNPIDEVNIEKLVQDCINSFHSYKEFSIQNRVNEKATIVHDIKNYDYDDPQRYLWGQKSENNNRTLNAFVIPIGKDSNKFTITLTVTGTNLNPLKGFVYFLVHPTFPEEIYKVLAKDNMATLQLDGFEAFTAGAVCDDGTTELELNLNKLENTPEGFRYKEIEVPLFENVAKPAAKRSKSVKQRKKK